MKRSMISVQGVSPRPRVPVGEDDTSRGHVLDETFSDVTLSDIYKKLLELLIEVAKRKEPRKAIRLSGVKELTGESRSQIYARMNPKYAAHDETWPRPFYIGRSPRWWLHEVEAWLEAQAASTAIRH